MRARSSLLATLLAVSLAACSGAAAASFNPAGPCAGDGHVAGAYPELEALVPRTLGGQTPSTLDSGRNCSAANLGTLATHGLREVRFAGGVWPDSQGGGITLAVFQAPGLQADWIGEWYEASARAARKTGNINVTKPVVGGREAHRMDLVNDESTQTVIAWPAAGSSGAAAAPAGVINVVLAADVPESRIQEALAAFP